MGQLFSEDAIFLRDAKAELGIEGSPGIVVSGEVVGIGELLRRDTWGLRKGVESIGGGVERLQADGRHNLLGRIGALDDDRTATEREGQPLLRLRRHHILPDHIAPDGDFHRGVRRVQIGEAHLGVERRPSVVVGREVVLG